MPGYLLIGFWKLFPCVKRWAGVGKIGLFVVLFGSKSSCILSFFVYVGALVKWLMFFYKCIIFRRTSNWILKSALSNVLLYLWALTLGTIAKNDSFIKPVINRRKLFSSYELWRWQMIESLFGRESKRMGSNFLILKFWHTFWVIDNFSEFDFHSAWVWWKFHSSYN